MVNGVNLMNRVYAANGKKVKRSNVTFRKKRWVDASFLIIVDACFLNIQVEDFFYI